jgi:hypothetical protein
MPVQG